MSITRKFLKGIGIEDEKVDAIIEAHTEVTNRMQTEIESLKAFKENAEKLPGVQKELDETKAKVAKIDELQAKYDSEHAAFEAYKKEIAGKESGRKVREAYTALLKKSKVDDKRFDSILRVTDFSKLKLDDEGKFENEKDLTDAIKADWADFIVTEESRGSKPETPPEGNGKTLTREEIMKIKDTKERQQAIADNPELFGIE